MKIDLLRRAATNVVKFTPPQREETLVESNEGGEDDDAHVDPNDMPAGAQVIYGSLSTLDLVNTTPEVFWDTFSNPISKAKAEWLRNALAKLGTLQSAMPGADQDRKTKG